MGIGDELVMELEKLFPSWDFVATYVKRQYCALVSRWHKHKFQLTSV